MTRATVNAALFLSVFVGAVPASSAQEIGPADNARVNAALVETHALPRYERLTTATEAVAATAEAFCAGGGETEGERLRSRFHDAMDAWMGVQHLRFGPVESFSRAYRFYFWPQARAKVADAVAELVAADEDNAALAARIESANVAVQGLLAAEVLLYDDRYLGGDAEGCGLLTAVAANMRTMAVGILTDWREGDGAFASLMAAPGPDNPQFEDQTAATLAFFQSLHDSLQLIRDVKLRPGPDNPQFEDQTAATLAFFQSLHDSLQLIRDVKLRPVIGESAQKVRPVLAESRLSGRSQRNIVVTLEALQALYLGEGDAGLGDLTTIADPTVARRRRSRNGPLGQPPGRGAHELTRKAHQV